MRVPPMVHWLRLSRGAALLLLACTHSALAQYRGGRSVTPHSTGGQHRSRPRAR